MLGVFLSGFTSGSSSLLSSTPLAAATPSPTPSTVSSDFASALPSWLLVALLGVVTLVIVAGFGLTAYSLSAPRSTLKNIIGRSDKKGGGQALTPPTATVTPQLINKLATNARSNKRTTRTTLAIVGFSLLGVVLIAIFGLSGQGVRDLRSQVVAAITTLVATIAGFYFGAETARNAGSQAGPAQSAPGLKPDPTNPVFTVGQPGSYAPILTGTPPATVSLSVGKLPDGLKLDPHTGVISGTPTPNTANPYELSLTAHNGVSPDASMQITITVRPALASAQPESP
jgi:hypothetical protein